MSVLIRAAEAEVLAGSGVTLFADVADTNGHLTSHRSLIKPGAAGAPAHLHKEASELFFVLSGSLLVLTGDDLNTLHHGDLLVVPPNTPHAFEAEGDEDTEVFFVLTHAKPRFDYYRLLERVYRGEADPAELAKTSDLYDNHYLESPTWQNRRR